MTTVQEKLKEFAKTASQLMGAEIRIFIARCPEFGNDDVCFIIAGNGHSAVAADFVKTCKTASIETLTGGGFRGRPTYTYSSVSISV